MCSNERTTSGSVSGGSLIPYPLAALKQLNDAPVPTPTSPTPSGGVSASLLPLDHYRLQLYNYAMAERLRFTHQLSHYPTPMPICPTYPAYNPRLAFSMSLFHHRALQPEEPKPQHSYIGLIAMAILSSPDLKLVLSDIYQHILDNYPYFRARGPGWRNSIRHNLSLNDCFIKAGRSANGKGHYWAIHAANIDDFRKGDFRRRKAQRKVRKHMGLSVDEEGNDSPSPPPVPVSPPMLPATMMPICWGSPSPTQTPIFPTLSYGIAKKRQFDVASLLAPDEEDVTRKRRLRAASSGDEDNGEEDIDVVNSEDKESVDAEDGVVTARQMLPGVLPGWPHQASAMFPGTPASLVASMEQQLVSRYYEQLAAAQQQQQQQRRFLLQQQGLCSVTIANGVNNNQSPDKSET